MSLVSQLVDSFVGNIRLISVHETEVHRILWFRSVNNTEKSGSVKGSDKITRRGCKAKGEANSHVLFSYAINVLEFDKIVLCCEKSEAHYVTYFTFYKCPPLP